MFIQNVFKFDIAARNSVSDDDKIGPTLESIRYFRPTGEPDADYETYRAYV